MKSVLETIDEFGELHFPETFDMVTVDGKRPRKLEICEDGKIRDINSEKKKKRKYCNISV